VATPDLELRFPPPKKPVKEPEESPRWLHGSAGLVIGSVLGLAVGKVLWRLLGIPRPASILVTSIGLAVAASIWRSRLWRWMNM